MSAIGAVLNSLKAIFAANGCHCSANKKSEIYISASGKIGIAMKRNPVHMTFAINAGRV